jgi:signal transduction histidine kinase
MHLAGAPDPVRVDADAFALGRVWRNLLQNAIDATPAGGQIHVSVDRDGTSARVRVRDTGRGIDPAHMPRVFDEFVTTKHRGLGLGLAICKRVVEQLDGQVGVESVVGAGTTFEVRLPLAGDGDAREHKATVADGNDNSPEGSRKT